MASAVPHSQCGIYTFPDGTDKQIVVNGVTGESVSLKLPVGIEAGGVYYDLVFSESGWSTLEPIGVEGGQAVKVSSLGWHLKACQTMPDGRVFIQDLKAKTTRWMDDPEFLCEKIVFTMPMYQQHRVATVFKTERQIFQTRFQHRCLGGRVFWDVRNLKEYLKFDYGDDEFHNRFVGENFSNVQTKFVDLFTKAGGASALLHFFVSEKSFFSKKAVPALSHVIDSAHYVITRHHVQ